MGLRTACGNMFLTTAFVKPYELPTKPNERPTIWWNVFQPDNNLERCCFGGWHQFRNIYEKVFWCLFQNHQVPLAIRKVRQIHQGFVKNSSQVPQVRPSVWQPWLHHSKTRFSGTQGPKNVIGVWSILGSSITYQQQSSFFFLTVVRSIFGPSIILQQGKQVLCFSRNIVFVEGWNKLLVPTPHMSQQLLKFQRLKVCKNNLLHPYGR